MRDNGFMSQGTEMKSYIDINDRDSGKMSENLEGVDCRTDGGKLGGRITK